MAESSLQENVELMFGNFKYDRIVPFYHSNNNYTVAIMNGKSGLIDFNGKQLTEFIYDDLSKEFVEEFPDDFGWMHFENSWNKYCRMRLNGKWGLLDKNGNIVVDFKYLNPVQEWGENFIIQSEEENFCTQLIIDRNQNVIKELYYDSITPEGEYAFVIKNGKCGLINNEFQTLIKCKYDSLHKMYEHKYLSAYNADKSGVVDLKGNVILDIIYDMVEIAKFDNKYTFSVKSNNKYALFNEEGIRIA